MQTMNGVRRLASSVILAVLFFSCQRAHAQAEALEQISKLRGINVTSDTNELARLNARMDSAWTFLKANKEESAPLLERQRNESLEHASDDPFFVLSA